MATPPDRVPLNALRVFEAVAAHLSFTAAAKELGVTTAAVSAQDQGARSRYRCALVPSSHARRGPHPGRSRLLPSVRRGLEELRRSVERIRRARRRHAQSQCAERNPAALAVAAPRRVYAGTPRSRFDSGRHVLRPRLRSRRFPRRHRLRSRPVDRPQGRAPARRIRVSGLQSRAARQVRPDRDGRRFCALPPDPQPHGAVAGLAAPGRRRYDACRLSPPMEDSAASLVAVEQGKGVALARWSLVAADIAAGRLVRPMLPSVLQRNAWFLVAPPANFSLPKVVRFRAWLLDCCREFSPPVGETLGVE